MLLPFAIASVFLALIFYSISVLRELLKKETTPKLLLLFWMGFFFDLTGTILMSLLSKGFSFNFHSVIGITALILMGIKAVWSTLAYKNKIEKKVPTPYLLFSWILWLFVFVFGFFAV